MLRRTHKALTHQTDEELLELYRSGKELTVLGDLYGRYTELVYGVCLKYLQQEESAADAVMDIFEELIGKVTKHEVRAFRPWLYTLAKNHCLMRLRKVGKNFTVPFDPGFMYSLEIPHLGEDVEDQEQQIQQLERCLQQLTDQQQRCIRRFYYDDKSYKEIAEMEQMDLGTIRSNIQNGRRNLKNCMDG